jgi:membrane dipeptidase
MDSINSTTHDKALARARALLTKVALFDGHNDLPWVIRIDREARGDVKAYDLNRQHQRGDTDIPRLREGLVGAQFWAAFQPTNAPHPARTALEQIDLVRRMEEAYPDTFLPSRKAGDVARAKKRGKIASFITVEGGVGLEESLAPLRIWHAVGVRLMTLCHNESLSWIDSATDAPRAGGLNAFGRAVIAELNRLGMIVDCAHVSHEAMRKVLDVSEAPIALSHSNAFALCDHPRNVPDDVLKRLRDNGGMVMATFVPGFISQPLRDYLSSTRDRYGKAPAGIDPKEALAAVEAQRGPAPRATLEELADHIIYLVNTAGIDHVGIGSDFFGGPQPLGLESVACFPALFAELFRRGFDEAALAKIASGNLLRVMRQVEKVGRKLSKERSPKLGRAEDFAG